MASARALANASSRPRLPGKLLLPCETSRLGDAHRAADLLPPPSRSPLPQGEGDLLVIVPLALHGTPPSWDSECPKTLRSASTSFEGQDQAHAADRWLSGLPHSAAHDPGLQGFCGCARASALQVPGRCASRTGCSRSASVSRRLTNRENLGRFYPSCGLRQSLR